LTRDGVRLTGTLYETERPRPAGLILVHARGGSRTDYKSFAQQAQREGYLALAFDLRGHGDSLSPSGVASSHHDFQAPHWQAVQYDIDAAKETILNAGADPENLAIVGAGLGANLALSYASTHEDIQAAVLLSPSRVEEGISAADAVKRFGMRPVMLLVTTGDTAGLATCQLLRDTVPGHCEIREYGGTARGAAIFDSASTSSGQVILWLSGIIGPNAARRNRELGWGNE
jgi:dienelactone hydrolase